MKINSIADIQQLVRDGFSRWGELGAVNVKQHNGLTLFNYAVPAQWGDWNYFERVSRGLILNTFTGEVVARPFDKFFNWGERGWTSLAKIDHITEKMDGSLGIAYFWENEWYVATRGSFDGYQAEWATGFLRSEYNTKRLDPGYTYLFEIIFPENRIVVDYGKLSTLVLLAMRGRVSGNYLHYRDVDEHAEDLMFMRPKVYTFKSVEAMIESCQMLSENEEGFVAWFTDGSMWKFKGAKYLELHKLITGLSWNRVHEALEKNDATLFDNLPDEFLTEANKWKDDILDRYQQIEADALLAVQEAGYMPRKEAAQLFFTHYKDVANVAFSILDGKDTRKQIFKLIKYEHEKPA